MGMNGDCYFFQKTGTSARTASNSVYVAAALSGTATVMNHPAISSVTTSAWVVSAMWTHRPVPSPVMVSTAKRYVPVLATTYTSSRVFSEKNVSSYFAVTSLKDGTSSYARESISG